MPVGYIAHHEFTRRYRILGQEELLGLVVQLQRKVQELETSVHELQTEVERLTREKKRQAAPFSSRKSFLL